MRPATTPALARHPSKEGNLRSTLALRDISSKKDNLGFVPTVER